MNLFDRFSSAVSAQVSRAWFFALCVLLVVVWAPSRPLFSNADTWQLIINTLTTILTFLLVALLQNAQAQFEHAVNIKLDAVLEAVKHADPPPSVVAQVEQAVGVENEVGAA